MPFKSKAQRERFKEFLKDGTISQATFDEMEKGTPMNLPERVAPKVKPLKVRVIGQQKRFRKRKR